MLTLRVSGQDGREIEVTTAQQWRAVRRSVDKMFDGWEELTTGRAAETTSLQTPPPVKKRYIPTPPPADYTGPTKTDYMERVLREAGHGLTIEALIDGMIAGGWETSSPTPQHRLRNVRATLSRTKEKFAKVGDLWMLLEQVPVTDAN